jgi:pimeloyl-ACP methyl ester carboxylesterase
MPSFEHHGAGIYYEEFGQGFPILTFAPAGLQSTIAVWSQPSAPINPTTEFADKFRVIAMDQRNAGGQSRAPITAGDGWDSYTADHITLLDHLDIDRCHLYGQCIGGSFILNMLKHNPERVQSAVLAQPIGRLGPMGPGRPGRFNAWAETLKDHPKATETVLDTFCRNLYAPGFVYCVDREFCRTVRTRASCWREATRPTLIRSPRNSQNYPELRLYLRLEVGGGADLGEGSCHGVSDKAHAIPRIARPLSFHFEPGGAPAPPAHAKRS